MQSHHTSLRWFLALLGVSLGLVASAHAAAAPSPTRLYEIAAVRFVQTDSGVVLQKGRLQATTSFRVDYENPVTIPPQTSPNILGRILIFTEAWTAFNDLGPKATANFEVVGGPLLVGGLVHFEVRARADAELSVGRLINISARGLVTADERMIAGFVVSDQHRRVLIRAVGPSLAPMGVTNPLPNPYLTVFRQNTPYYYNDDWGNRFDADEIARVSAKVGAFPLPAGSKDAAIVVELQPGIYSVHAEPEAGSGEGTVLLEVYSVPND